MGSDVQWRTRERARWGAKCGSIFGDWWFGNERVRDDRRFTISDLFLHFPQISRTLFYDIVSSNLERRRPHSMRRVHKNLCPATINTSIMAANMWKNSLKNVESDNKILYENLLDFFYSETVIYILNKPRNTSSHFIRSVQLISILLQHHISKLSSYFWSTFRNVPSSSTIQKMCTKWSTLLVSSLNLRKICWWKGSSSCWLLLLPCQSWN